MGRSALGVRSGGRSHGEVIEPMGERSIEFGWSLSGRVLAGLEQGIVVLDGRGRVLLANPAARTLLGVGDDVEGRNAAEVFSEVPDLMLGAATGWEEVSVLIREQ